MAAAQTSMVSKMRHATIEKFCLALPAATLTVQWEGMRVYKVGGKMFAMLGPKEQKPHELHFKASETSIFILTQLPDIVPAPYLARAGWVTMKRIDALPDKDVKAYLEQAHAMIAAKLPKKKRAELGLN
jgi:predicted DNA-binding protein (MmcQ/YjbR family)